MQQYCKYNITFATMFQISKLIYRLSAVVLLICWHDFAHTQTLTGTVFNSATNEAVPYAMVYIVEIESGTVADSAGSFTIRNFPSSQVTLRVSAPGFTTFSETYTHKQGIRKEIMLSPIHIHLDEVVVSTPFGRLQHETVTNVETRRLSELNRIPSTTLGEAISTIPGVYVSTLGVGIGKPVIRGLSGTRIVTYLNGLRIENQQWGDDHGLGVTDVGIESVEVIKGPASLLYGSDALGGVMYFVNQPYAKLNRFESYYQTRFESNTLGNTSEMGFKFNRDGFKINLFAGQSVHADFMLPNGKRVLDSRFSSTTVKSSIGYNKKNWVGNLHYAFLKSYIGIPGHSHQDSLYAELFHTTEVNWLKTLPYQDITNHYFSFENKLYFGKSQLEIILGNTNNHLREYEEKVTIPGIDLSLNNSVYNIKWRTDVSKKIQAIIGSQGMYQVNQNGSKAEEILIPDNTTTDAGIYGLLQLDLRKWIFQGGARFDNRAIATDPVGGFEVFSHTYQSYNYAAGLSYSTDSIVLRFNFSTGFRAPHSSELLSNGVHHGTFRYTIGDTELATENAMQADFSMGIRYDHLEITFNPFFNQVENYIFLNPTDSVIDGYHVFTYTQAGKAQLFGGDLALHMHPHIAHWLHIQTSFSYLYGQYDNGLPLPLIPQTRLNSQLKFELHSDRKFSISDIVIQHSLYFQQDRTSSFETETPAYNLVHAGINMTLETKGQPVYIGFGVKNLLNTSYFDHLSRLKQIGLEHPGVNGYLSVKYNFEKRINQKKR